LPKTVGGGGVHADLKTPRFQKTDFQLGTLLGDVPDASFADWAVDYDELEKYYARAETVLGVQGQDGADPFAAPRSTKYIMPPGAPMYMGLKVSDGCKKLGLNPFPYPAAVNSRNYDGRPACIDCGWCSGYGCPTNAKGSPPVTALRRALLSGNCLLLPETRASKLLMNASGTQVTGIETIGPDGKKKVYQADQYVLAASPIEDVRLLYLSGAGSAIGNSSGLVGRNLMFHYQTVAVGVFKERLHGHRGRTVSHGFSDFRGVPGDPNRPLGGIVEIGSYIGPISEADYVRRILAELPTGFDGEIYKDMLRQSPFRDRLVGLTMQAEDAPQPTNTVDLDPDLRDIDGLPVARVTYKPHNFETSASAFYQPKLLEVLGAAGAKYTFITPQPDISESAHVMGTLRMGNDPKSSVCNKDGRFHDIGNLYNADGALFPTSAGYNPTLTLMALAMRVGAAMVNKASPESAIAGGPLD
jgi:choline dehydrogenase-like flavoprotein